MVGGVKRFCAESLCALILALLSMACQQEDYVDEITPFEVVREYEASLEQDGTKTALSDGSKVLWKKGDVVRYYSEDGGEVREFSVLQDGASAHLSLVTGGKPSFVAAVYGAADLLSPKASMVVIDGIAGKEQSGRFEDAHVSVAFTTDPESESLSFLNLTSLLSFRIEGDNIDYVVFRPAAKVPTGTALLRFKEGAPDIQNLISLDEPVSEITVRTASKPGEYFISLLPCVISGGFSIELYDKSSNLVRKKQTDKELTLTRNCILNLGTIDAQVQVSSIVLKPTNLTLSRGQSSQITAEVLPENATDKTLVWNTSDPSIVTVSDEGTLVAGLTAGAAVVTATSVSNPAVTAYCVVMVKSGNITGLTYVPARTFDGKGLITSQMFYYGGSTLNNVYPFVKVPSSKSAYSFLSSSQVPVTYRMDPQNADVSDYDFSFVNSTVYSTKTAGEKSDLVSIISGPVQSGSNLTFNIAFNKQIKEIGYNQNNDIVALKALSKTDGSSAISDYSYVESQSNYKYEIIHKDGYQRGEPRPYRTSASSVAYYNPCDGDAPGITNHYGTLNPTGLVLNYKSEIDLLDYVDTYAVEFGDVLSCFGISPSYEFWLATTDGTDSSVRIGKNGRSVVYATDSSAANQNKYVVLNGSKLRVDYDYVSSGIVAVGHTPLIYVRSSVQGKPIAEAFIKVRIVADGPEPEIISGSKLGRKVFTIHDVRFKDLTSTPTYTGYAGRAISPLKPAEDPSDHTLNVDETEFDQWILDELKMPYEIFAKRYDLSDPKLILKNNSGTPSAIISSYDNFSSLDENNTIIASIGDIATFYPGTLVNVNTPFNWEQDLPSVNIQLTNGAPEDGKCYRVYLLYQAVDNERNVDVVLEFVYTVDRHSHDYTIFNWTLNPSFLLNDSPDKPWLLNADRPYASTNADRSKYGVVRVSGKYGPNESYIIEHFKEYGSNGNISVKDDAEYTFEVVNYAEDDVHFSNLSTGTVGSTSSGGRRYSNVTLTAQDLRSVVNMSRTSPCLILNFQSTPAAGDILIKVTETCLRTNDYKDAYYYVAPLAVPEAVDLGLSVKWASFNLGASQPEEFGDYFAWGETGVKSNYDWSTYCWCNGSYESLTKYNSYSGAGVRDNKTTLEAGDDACQLYFDGNWRMPTDAEMEELKNSCTWTADSMNGIEGYRVTSQKSGYTGQSIFLPKAGFQSGSSSVSGGYYWTSQLIDTYACLVTYNIVPSAICLNFDFLSKSTIPTTNPIDNKWAPRSWGLPIRPVRD